MIKAADIQRELSQMKVLHGRTIHTTDAEEEDVFAELAEFNNGSVFVGSFSGESSWERHPNGDELVHVLKGQATIIILSDGGDQEITLSEGMVVVVPQGLWHRFVVPELVTLFTATPLPTEISLEDDPRI
ncbi:MAG: cupin domain-containing protein [Thiolinea sp.]